MQQVITPKTDCYDHRKPTQTCDSETWFDYYFYNITNSEAVRGVGGVPSLCTGGVVGGGMWGGRDTVGWAGTCTPALPHTRARV